MPLFYRFSPFALSDSFRVYSRARLTLFTPAPKRVPSGSDRGFAFPFHRCSFLRLGRLPRLDHDNARNWFSKLRKPFCCSQYQPNLTHSHQQRQCCQLRLLVCARLNQFFIQYSRVNHRLASTPIGRQLSSSSSRLHRYRTLCCFWFCSTNPLAEVRSLSPRLVDIWRL